jgi:GcrA cell cycle regulator
MWADGMSASRIAVALGLPTRNAVIGKLHRLGLGGRGQTRRRSQQQEAVLVRRRKACDDARREIIRSDAARRPEPKGQKAIVSELFRKVHLPSEPVPTSPDLVPTVSRIAELPDDKCKWPTGDGPFHFCGRNKVGGLVYCEFHAKRAYAPAKIALPYANPLVVRQAKADNAIHEAVAEFVGA